MAESLTLGQLACHVGLEKHHFGRKYKALTGITPMRAVRRRKAEHARRMILSGTLLMNDPLLNLRNIAKRVGVRDEHQMSRLLTRYVGGSVRELKRAALKSHRQKKPVKR